MDSSTFVKGLVQTLDRREVINAINTVYTETDEFTLPIIESIMEDASIADVIERTPTMTQLGAAIKREVRYDGLLSLFKLSLEGVKSQLDVIKALAKTNIGTKVAVETVTFNQATMLQYVEYMGFYTRYLRRALLVALGEINASKGSVTRSSWTKGDMEWLNVTRADFAQLSRVVLIKDSEFTRLLKSIPDIEISEAASDAARAVVSGRLDPLRLRNMKAAINPLFSLGKVFAEFQVFVYRLAKEEKQALELRLQEIKELEAGGKANPKMQRYIQQTEERIAKYSYQIEKFEDDANFDRDAA